MKNGFSLKQAKRNSLTLLFALSLLILPACQKDGIDEDKLVRIYVENLIIEETHQDNPETLKQKKENLFKKFNTSKAKFENELSKLGSDRERWDSFFTKSRALLEDLHKSGAVN